MMKIDITHFMIQFLICNIYISCIIVIFIIVKHLINKMLSSRMQFNLWFILLWLLTVPFIPFHFNDFPSFLSWIHLLSSTFVSNSKIPSNENISIHFNENVNWIYDFTLSISSETPSIAGNILFGIWMIGILFMIGMIVRSFFNLCTIKKSALPLQNNKIHFLYLKCLKETKINRKIPIYSSAYLKSPIIVGVIRPCIYLPIHLISDYNETDIKYILLHELQHYKYKDVAINYIIYLFRIAYWFNPFVLYSLQEMRNDQEIACDSSVLKRLDESDYVSYGNALINFAEKVYIKTFPFTSGISSNYKQLERRIISIVSHKRPTLIRKIKSLTIFIIISSVLIGLTPYFSIYALDYQYYHWDYSNKNIVSMDLSSYFSNFEGSFALYDLKSETWHIHDIKQSSLRVAPNSTYKIYDGLFGLEEGIITPEDSFIAWKGDNYPFDAWNKDQTLQSAINSSVNWYFQSIDKQLGFPDIYSYLKKIEYGNMDIKGDISSYWMESSLKISAIEQVELLVQLQSNSFNFAPNNIALVKDAICLTSSENGTLYGKTGTGRIDDQDINGWFVGFIESLDNTYFFATNIQANNNATGSNATKITMSILSDMNIWE